MKRCDHAHPTCKTPGCERATVARGMCYMHYQIWKRSNRGAIIKLDVDQMILDALPAKRAQIEQATGLHEVTVLRHLPRLREKGKVFILDFEPPTLTSKHWTPIYARGKKPDAVVSRERKQQQAAIRRAERELAAEQKQEALLYADLFNLTGRRPDVVAKPQGQEP